jgi:gamma-glutamyltranspeptidase/glutathione hydrolase
MISCTSLRATRRTGRRNDCLGGVLVFTALLAGLHAAGAAAVDAPARGRRGMVVCAEPAAAHAAVAVLREGGSAADAAITAAFVLAVTEPYASGLGGGGLIVGYDRHERRAYALDARETAPAAATPRMFLGDDGAVVADRSRTGALSVAVPGLVRGLWQLHQSCGRLPWPRLLAPAVTLARDGFAMPEMLTARLAEQHALGRLAADFQAVFLPRGRLPDPGDRLVQGDLARTLGQLAQAGPAAFYTGEIAVAMVAAVQAAGGLLTTDDLAAYRAVWREPIRGHYRGHTVVSMPPPSSGGVHLVQMLNILADFDLAAAGYGSAEAWHPMLEAMKLAYRDRSLYLGDPDFSTVPVDWLISRARADSLRAGLRHDRVAMPAEEPAGGVPAAVVSPEPEHTTHVSVVDADGNAVAATLTINLFFGSGMLAAGTGVILNDQMDDFAAAAHAPNAFGLIQGEANAVAPGKRPLSSMTPTLVLDRDDVVLVAGSPGGSVIITATLQAIIHVLDFGMDARQAVSAPRVHHQWSPSDAWHESFGMSPSTRRELERRGHTFRTRPLMGNVQLIVRDRAAGVWTGASDPRGMGLAIGY